MHEVITIEPREGGYRLSTFSSSSSQSVRSVKIAICPYYSLTPKPSADTPRAVISPSISSEIRETRDFRAKLIPNSPDSVVYFFCSVKNVYNHNVTAERGLWKGALKRE